ncbi:hypothetical protein QBC32DRAFT_317874 [Pseudoneurospora amorphoporcata]|uniref:RNase H type-1 domain-containing protein n=1 Tax=Pseudoneurospora amorphoporcata TaxID=241081 RepID=A0AAN6SCY1_9PEZI|nr:hypothetical protein QBC32DRAFT_317874 [Pseudoneurospora amorphoporcata]
MAWSMREMLDNSVGESLAFAQAFQPCFLVQYNIFSLSPSLSLWSKSFRWGLFEKIVRLVRQLSHEVCSIPGYDVSIEVYWVKGHANVEGNERADELSNQARIESRNIFITDGKERDANLLPPAVHAQLMDDIDREASRHRPAQEQTAQNGHAPNGRVWVNRGRNDRGRHSQQRYPRGRGNNAKSFPRFTSNPRGPYSPPPWASESFNPNFDPIRMPRYPRTFPSSSQGGERPHVSEDSRPETNELTGFYDLDPGSVADEQEPLLERFLDEGKAESEPEIQGPVCIPTVVAEPAANKQALACDNVANPEKSLREREACESQIPLNHEDVPEKEPTPDLEGRTCVSPSDAEDDESAMELLLNEQIPSHPQLACECRTQDDLALVDDKDDHGPDETHMHEDAMSEEQIQAAVDRQLEEEAEAALARRMASGVQENVSPGPLPVEVQFQWT